MLDGSKIEPRKSIRSSSVVESQLSIPESQSSNPIRASVIGLSTIEKFAPEYNIVWYDENIISESKLVILASLNEYGYKVMQFSDLQQGDIVVQAWLK